VANSVIDHALAESIKTVQSGGSYTIVYLSTPGEAPEVQREPVHQELKKRATYSQVVRREDEGDTERDTRPLFEKYEFFNKGMR